ncbi:MAG TPA: ATP-dependent helicase HrpB, partial [Solibacterales bacterium]|nr:ATP-dependent helicase HrpB [Bryobacterales bacterium]
VAASDLFVLMEGEWQPQTRQIYDRLRRGVRRGKHQDQALRMAVLAAFPDRVARRRNGRELLLAGGGSAVLEESSVVEAHEFLVAIDVEERRERGLPLVRLASAIEPEWLLDFFPGRVTERNALEWNRAAQRVEAVSAMLFDGLVIAESRGARPDPLEAAKLLAAKAVEAGVERFVDPDELNAFAERVQFASSIDDGIPALDQAAIEAGLAELAAGAR